MKYCIPLRFSGLVVLKLDTIEPQCLRVAMTTRYLYTVWQGCPTPTLPWFDTSKSRKHLKRLGNLLVRIWVLHNGKMLITYSNELTSLLSQMITWNESCSWDLNLWPWLSTLQSVSLRQRWSLYFCNLSATKVKVADWSLHLWLVHVFLYNGLRLDQSNPTIKISKSVFGVSFTFCHQLYLFSIIMSLSISCLYSPILPASLSLSWSFFIVLLFPNFLLSSFILSFSICCVSMSINQCAQAPWPKQLHRVLSLSLILYSSVSFINVFFPFKEVTDSLRSPYRHTFNLHTHTHKK